MFEFRQPDPKWIIGKYAVLNVHAKIRNGRTEIDPHAWRIPYQWQGYHYQDHDDQPFLMLINSGGGFVEDDAAEFNALLDPNTRMLVTTTAASKYYKSLNGGSCTELVRVKVGEGAVLEYLPDEAIPFAKSRVSRRTTIDLSRTSRLFATDMIAAGRIHYGAGEEFAFSELFSEFSINVDGVPVICDRLILANIEDVNHLRTLWNKARHLATVFCYGPGLPDGVEGSIEALASGDGLSIGASWAGDVLVTRILARETWQAQDAVFAVWQIVRPHFCGKSARPIKKC